ncbi:helix-turn-helix domain-containing protein [Staphylococcus equorum]|uniref:helix-turn-helix domain-containing protein n=1 Tax=Staphylococcus equorum TaxID=246432 RepID=UPI00255312CF|nr:helix-turn-helix domain-containing protein [Staphylococcus equorum]MDK9860913.1 helix-turn-helix domain-containing protein [Staphylococcus equorum]MDW4068073.1 helix-turn-helix domain-containing protein [Staphylococcus saprophyticus]MDW4082745.1 helix-turn-helix domain-containing protein [Staphylococcus saprophyticus]
MARPVLTAPNKANTVNERENVTFKPLYARPTALSEVMGISFSTVRRVLLEYEADSDTNVEDLFIYVTETLKVVDIQKFVDYLKEREQNSL